MTASSFAENKNRENFQTNQMKWFIQMAEPCWALLESERGWFTLGNSGFDASVFVCLFPSEKAKSREPAKPQNDAATLTPTDKLTQVHPIADGVWPWPGHRSATRNLEVKYQPESTQAISTSAAVSTYSSPLFVGIVKLDQTPKDQ